MTDEGMNKLKDLRKKYELLAKYNGGEDYIAFKVLDMAVKELSKPNKCGKWIHDGSNWKNRFVCSECEYKLFDEQTAFCPNCGAKMEGGAND